MIADPDGPSGRLDLPQDDRLAAVGEPGDHPRPAAGAGQRGRVGAAYHWYQSVERYTPTVGGSSKTAAKPAWKSGSR